MNPEPRPKPQANPPDEADGAGGQPSVSRRAQAQMMQARLAGGALETHLAQMNEAQMQAVTAPDGALLVLAGAGTGKTRVLTTRIAYKIATGQLYPRHCLAVTFTNKAAQEMKMRIQSMLGASMEDMRWLGTFHSISAKILRIHAELVGLRSDFTILDTDDQIRLLKQLIQEKDIDEKRWPARQLATLIDQWKNRGLFAEQLPDAESALFANGRGQELYQLYQKRLKILNATDFGDLLLEAVRLFRTHGDILRGFQSRFQHILVDEYQDTNSAQYMWLRLLAQPRGNICCVGDDDQSIYGWRGAEVDNILRFEQDFPGAQIIRLERNYRSTAHILGAASGLIAGNQKRLGKTLWTEDNEGEKLRVQGYQNSEEEARLTCDDIEAAQRKQHKLNEIAILVRASHQMREFEEKFIATGIPYRVIGGPRFYERAEIRDANAYLRLIAQPDDDLAFERICNKPKRGLGDVSLRALRGRAQARGISLFRTAAEHIAEAGLKPTARHALTGFIHNVQRWQAQKESITHDKLAQLVLDESGYLDMWRADKSADAPGRLENLDELVRSMEDFESLAAYLEHIALVMDINDESSDDKVSLMTLHAAKGLEFETVFLPGWEEDIFPNKRSLDEHGDRALEEERRLAHVGLTRAKKHITISFTGSRRVHGQWQSNIPSRFIDEIPEKHIEIGESGGQSGLRKGEEVNLAGYDSPGWRRAQNYLQKQASGSAHTQHKQHAQHKQHKRYKQHKPSATKKRPAQVSAKQKVSGGQFQMGERIFHQKFGYGRIADIAGNKVTIAFEKAGVKKVLDQFLEKI